MKLPEKTTPLLLVLLIAAAFLIGRYQGQLELLKGGSTSGTRTVQQPTTQQGIQPGTQQGQDPNAQLPPQTQLTDDQWQNLLAFPVAAKGDDSAPVTIVEFTDYQCPYCSQYFTSTYPQINEQYINTGKVRYMVRDFPLPFHGNAAIAAQAARCAGDGGKYWEMHEVLFEKQEDWSSGNPTETFTSYAGDIGINTGSFSDCLSSEKYKQAVDDDLELAQQLGVGGTPGFFINGKLLVGAQPFSAFETEIESNF